MLFTPRPNPFDRLDALASQIAELRARLDAQAAPAPMAELLTVKQAAQLLGCQVGRVYELIRERGGLPHIVEGSGPRGTIKIPRKAVSEYVARRLQKGRAKSSRR